jgi:hypothetical protein
MSAILDGKAIPHSFEYILAAVEWAEADRTYRLANARSKRWDRDLGKLSEARFKAGAEFDRIAKHEESR